MVKQKSRREVRSSTAGWERKQEVEQHLNFERVKHEASPLYAGIDPRRWREVADSGMVQEDPNAIANLPTRPIHREYTRFGFFSTPYIDDTTE